MDKFVRVDFMFDSVPTRGKNSSGSSPRRAFIRSYVTLTSNGKVMPLVNLSLQKSAPTLHRPCTSGSGVSKVMDCLERSHGWKDFPAEEKEMIALCLDLGVLFYGSYLEGWLRARAEKLHYK